MTLPTDADLQHIIMYGGFLKEKKIHLNFEWWTDEDEGLLIPKLWFNIYTAPKRLRELPVVWAVGSMMGAPRLADMVASKKNDYVRVLVSVLDSKNLPAKLSVVIGDRWFEFPVKVESIIPGVESFVETSIDGDKDGNTGDGNSMSGDVMRDQDNHKEGNGSANNQSDMDIAKEHTGQEDQRDAALPVNYESMAHDILDFVTGQLFEEIADKVLAEDDGPLVAPATAATADSSSVAAASTLLAVEEELQEGCEDLSLFTPPVVRHSAEMAAAACLGPQKNKVDRPVTPAELAPVAMLEELKETPTRRTSKRRANSLDEHSLDRAQRLTAMRNLDVPKGTRPSASFLSLTDDCIISNITNLGVLMGVSESQSKCVTRHIRELEHGRLASSPENQSKVKSDLSKDLDALEDTENDGFDQLMIKEMNSAALEDFLTENNSHLGDICPLKSRKKSISSKIKPVPKKR